jgi:hypothetical protein
MERNKKVHVDQARVEGTRPVLIKPMEPETNKQSQPPVCEDEGTEQAARVQQRAAKIRSIGDDGLPTTVVRVGKARMGLKLDTCAVYSVASPDRKRYGTRLPGPAR